MICGIKNENPDGGMFEQLFEISINELYIFYPNSLKYFAVNSTARNNLKYTIEELNTMSIIDINPELNVEKLLELINILIIGERNKVFFETINRRKDGSFYPVKMNLQLFDYKGEKLCLAQAVELTEIKRLEEEKSRKEKQCSLMINGIPSPAWLISKERIILDQNKAAMILFGTKVGDYCCKMTIEENGQVKYSECYFCLADEALETKKTINREIEFRGRIWNKWWIPLGDDIYLHYAADITKYKKMEEELRNLSEKDALTNTYNRRYFTKKLEEEIERAKRSGSSFSVIMLDIDHFKRINDNFGHNAGDLVLKSVAKFINNRIRKTDILARWGGEEFILFLPYTSVENAVFLAEQIRKTLSEKEIPAVGRVTASLGVAGYIPGDTVDSLVNKADNMMYEAKSAGRNCVRYIVPEFSTADGRYSFKTIIKLTKETN